MTIWPTAIDAKWAASESTIRGPSLWMPTDFRNCSRTVYRCSLLAPLAQSVERLHGKEKVFGSIP